MPKCIVCGYSSRKRTEFFRCWNKETELGCKRYTCNNCVFIIRETTGYSNFICPNTFCNEEHEAERLVGLKQWFEPDKKIAYDERIQLLKNRENEVEKHLKKWQEKISFATKRTVFASKKASESEKFMKHEFKQLDFNFYQKKASSYFYPPDDLRGAYLTNISFSTMWSDLLKFKPRLRIKSNGTPLLDLALTSENQLFTLNFPIATSDGIDAEIECYNTYEFEQYRNRDHHNSDILSATLTLEFVGGS